MIFVMTKREVTAALSAYYTCQVHIIQGGMHNRTLAVEVL